MFSKACEYSIRASIYIAKHSQLVEKVSLKEIAQHTDTPPAFIAKILQKLTKTDILSSLKGPNGGFFFPAEKVEEVSLYHIVIAIDGEGIFENCSLGLRLCDDQKPCPIHHEFVKFRDEMRAHLKATSLYFLANQVSEGVVFLKR